jgi:hypothetical protein
MPEEKLVLVAPDGNEKVIFEGKVLLIIKN